MNGFKREKSALITGATGFIGSRLTKKLIQCGWDVHAIIRIGSSLQELEPFLDNENFRKAIKDYNEEDFKTYDKRIREDVDLLMNNLMNKYRYTPLGAKEVCMYVIDNDLAKQFETK